MSCVRGVRHGTGLSSIAATPINAIGREIVRRGQELLGADDGGALRKKIVHLFLPKRFDVHKFIKAKFRELAAIARRFDATKRQAQI